ncbi:Hypothetical protein PHPALM_2319 [Phytophthora palmivora]|uniref:Chromo domain-containing protein n=1 Tax=Phytophthora palmivora TaxID=4796 RepID=A0A2P4YQ28_9STRA|nr:Hypothetical protein PHPALM_2319 [Phytophthora palmivora]
MWHGTFRVIEMIGNHAVRLETAGSGYRIFPIVHLSKLKPVRVFPDRPTTALTVTEDDRIHLDEAILPEDSWENPLESDEYEVERIAGGCAFTLLNYVGDPRVFKAFWKGYDDPSWVDEADLNCGALLHEYERRRTSRNRFHAMQTHEEEGNDP